mmetsp:Transcript_15418/g.23101  ORF Transcript_15418/g.23101 Transcript_15418/m.23101 type:complete len:186 (-) Transcript_15418:57-614(-)
MPKTNVSESVLKLQGNKKTTTRIDAARKVDEALLNWSSGDETVANPFPGIKLHKTESKEDVIGKVLSSWGGADWAQRDKALQKKIDHEKTTKGFQDKAFPGIEVHDDSLQDISVLPGAQKTKSSSAPASSSSSTASSPRGKPQQPTSSGRNKQPPRKKKKKSSTSNIAGKQTPKKRRQRRKSTKS